MTKILKNVNVSFDKKYSQSYGNKITVYYPYAKIQGIWLVMFDELGNHCKMNTTGKHFHGYSFGSEISEEQFEIEISENLEILKKENLKKADQAKKESELRDIEILQTIEIVKANISLIESKRSSYNVGGCKWCNEVAFKAAGQLNVNASILRAVLKNIYYAKRAAKRTALKY